ncbi:MAG: thioredoxin [Actinomycetia bacterium]|nr:thioredoxin [Actinomycetes bacterium]
MPATTDVTDATFQATVLESDRPVLVDFWADWCSPCQLLAPVIEELAEQYQGRLRVVKVDTNENPVTPATYGVLNLPALLFFSGGQVVQEIRGGTTKTRLRKVIDEIV